MNEINMRPGVYSSYSVSSRYATPRSRKAAALLVPLEPALLGRTHAVETAKELTALLGANPTNRFALHCGRLLLESAVSKVFLVGIASPLKSSLTLLDSLDSVGIFLTSVSEGTDVLAMREWMENSGNGQREGLCFFGFDLEDQALAMAEKLNHERCVVCTPTLRYEDQHHSLFGGCALAGLILSENKPTYNLNGAELKFVTEAKKLPEETLQKLIAGGVTVLESVGNCVECVRGVTTRTNNNGTPDYSLRSVNTTLIIDDVMSSVRSSLKERLKGTGLSSASLDSVASQVLIELSAKEQEGLLESYQPPRMTPHENDPSICVIELAFTIAHVISQIHITAHIQL